MALSSSAFASAVGTRSFDGSKQAQHEMLLQKWEAAAGNPLPMMVAGVDANYYIYKSVYLQIIRTPSHLSFSNKSVARITLVSPIYRMGVLL